MAEAFATPVGLGGPMNAINHEAITVSSTAVGFTTSETLQTVTKDGGSTVNVGGAFTGATVTTRAKAALVTVETQSVRVTLDGTTATTTVGHLLAAGDALLIHGTDCIRKARFIAVTTDATIQVTFFTW